MKNDKFYSGCKAATNVISKASMWLVGGLIVATAAGIGVSLAWDIRERKEANLSINPKKH